MKCQTNKTSHRCPVIALPVVLVPTMIERLVLLVHFLVVPGLVHLVALVNILRSFSFS